MATVGIRELKQNLSKYIKRVKSGECITITERRKGVALMLPLGDGETRQKVAKLIQEGKATWSGGKPKGLEPRIILKGKTVSSAVIEDRR